MSSRSTSVAARAARVAVATGLVVAGTLGTASAAVADSGRGGGSGGGSSSSSRTTAFDFTDAFYRANGIDPAGLVGRRSVGDGISVADTAPDANHRGVRSKLTLPAYDTSGNAYFFTVLADLGPNGFTADATGRAAQALADASPVYVFPTRDGDPTSVGNNRQADMIDLRHGYFSNNPTGIWVHVFVTWTPAAFDTPAGRRALADLLRKNGRALDGTPIITSQSELDSLTQQRLVLQTRRPVGSEGRYFVCPVFKDPRGGAIAPDAFLATVRRPDGTALPAEQQFVRDFTSLQQTGDHPKD